MIPYPYLRQGILTLLTWFALLPLAVAQESAPIGTPAVAPEAVLIDFEDLPSTPTPVTDQYTDKGVSFNDPTGLNLPEVARSGSHAIEPCFSMEFCNKPIEMRFVAGQTRVTVWVGYSGRLSETRTISIRALGSGGSIEDEAITTFGPSLGPLPISTPLEVTSPSGSIRSVEVRFSPESTFTNSLAVDDVEFVAAPVLPTEPFTYEIDPNLVLEQPNLPGLDGGPPQPAGAMVGPDGGRDEYVVTEVVFHPDSGDELNTFLAQYEGTVLRDGMPDLIPDAPHRGPAQSSGWYLIRVNLQRSAVDDLTANAEAAGLGGHFLFSSDDAARLAALVLRESPRWAVGPSLLLNDDTREHPDDSGGNLDAATWTWMTEDDDTSTPGTQGLSIGVINAWNYLKYQGLPPIGGGTWTPPVVAIVDRGFDLDQSTGVPLNGNLDYFYLGAAPRQADIVDRDGRAGGPGDGDGGEWHGQGAFGACCAYPGNQYGGAGSGGPVARPMLIRIDGRFYNRGYGIWSAAVNGADVITISSGGFCGHLCRVAEEIFFESGLDDILVMGVDLATGWGAAVVASAGNDATDLDGADIERTPCELARVICVGAINNTLPLMPGAELAWSSSNWGDNVDIWSPTNIFSTVTPDSCCGPGKDTNNIGADEVLMFGGTSAAAPFAAGIIALMKTLDLTLRWDEVETILQDTANASSDPKVKPGYVDAFGAVARVIANQPPTVNITVPNKPTGSYARVYYLDSDWDDPEPGALLPLFQDARSVTYTSSSDGMLCTATAAYLDDTTLGCQMLAPLSLGTHVITAIGTDPYGAQASDSVTITITNQPPIARILQPADGSTFRDNQIIRVDASVIDPDAQVASDDIVWSSSIDGVLKTGRSVKLPPLSQGVHTITVTATDEFGLAMHDSIMVSVVPAAGFPSAEILDLPPGTSPFLSPGESITLEGIAFDTEDGTLTGSSLEWVSSRDGPLGNGNTITAVLSGPDNLCNPETVRHTITLRVTDSDGHQTTDEIRITVGEIC